MNVLFIVTSYWAYGELLIALQFARNIQKSGYKPYFLIPPCHQKIIKEYNIPHTLLIPNAGPVNRILMKDIEQLYKPRYVILSDFLNYSFCERHYGINTEDLKIFSGKVGTFDNFDWKLRRSMMDTYGFPAKTVRSVNVDNFGFRLNPCPIINPLAGACKDRYPYPLVDNYLEYNDTVRENTKRELGLPLKKPLLLTTSAAWQQKYMEYENVKSFVELSDDIYYKIIGECAKDSTVVYVGADKDHILSGCDNVILLKSLPTSEFDKYACASDLFISRNVTSTTLARLALSGIPCVTVMNSLSFNKKTGDAINIPHNIDASLRERIQGLELCYPYYMYPVGWHRFLEPVVKNNPYSEIVSLVEQFDIESSMQTIHEHLHSKEVRDIKAQKVNQFKKHLESLPKPHQIMDMLN